MTNKATKYGLMTIAAVLLVAMAFAGAVSAEITGTGTKLDPYTINSADDLNTMAGWINAGQNATANYTLCTDITFNGATYYPIGNTSSNPFQGHFDGKNHNMSGKLSSTSSSFGIFGFIKNASIENIVLKDLKVTVTYSNSAIAGALVAKMEDDGSGSIFTTDEGKNSYHSHITNVEMNNVSISATGSTGGLVGYITSCSLWIENVVADENCTVSGNGGLVCGTNSASIAIVDSTVHSKSISSKNDRVGGLIGPNYHASVKLQDCKVSGVALSGTNCVGGLIGHSLGYMSTPTYLNISGCTVADCTITLTKVAANRGGAGLVGLFSNNIPATAIYLNNVMDNVTVKPAGTYGARIVGLVESTDNAFNSGLDISLSSLTDSIAPLKEIVIGNNITIRNSSICPYGSTAVKTSVNQTDYANVLGRISSVSVGNKITSIDANAFNGASNLKSITDMDKVTSIGANAFTDTGIASLVLPKTAAEGYSAVWILQNETHDEITSLTTDKFAYAVEKKERQEVTLDARGGIVSGKLIVNKSEIPGTAPISLKAGYNFSGWYGETELTNMVFNETGVVNKSVSGWTDADGKWIHNGASTLYANCTLNSTDVKASGNKAVFGNENVTAIHSESGIVVKVLLDEVSNVTNTAVNFTADNTTVQIPGITGYLKDEISIFDLNATAYGTAKINVTVTFVNDTIATAKKGNVSFYHYNTTNNAWDTTPLTFTMVQNGADVLYTVETNSFSPFGIGIYTPITYTVHFDANGGQGSMADMTFTYDVGQNLTANAFQRYNSNFLYWTYNGNKYYNTEFVQNLTTVDGYTVMMTAQWETYSTGGSSSGSTYMGSNSASYTPTQQPTVKPTIAPTAAPTEQPATPTVIATAKPTTQATQQSPAPFVGLLAGLGAAAVLLRLRK